MSIDWENVRSNVESFVSRAVEKAGDITREASDKAEEMTQMGKVKLDVVQLNRKKENLYTKIGKKTCELIEDEKEVVENDEIGSYRSKIKDLNDKIEKKESKLEDIKKQKSSTSAVEETEKEEEKKDEEQEKSE